MYIYLYTINLSIAALRLDLWSFYHSLFSHECLFRISNPYPHPSLLSYNRRSYLYSIIQPLMNTKRVFITTSIPYVNAVPHIGYALETIQADALARWYRNAGYETFLSAGTDENAIKNIEAAEKAGIPIQEFVNNNSDRFADLKQTLMFSYDDFIQTSGAKHKAGAQKFWQLCKNDIYKKTYRGLYCVGCETFYEDGEFPNNICPLHNRSLENVEEENYFFRLSYYQKQLHDKITTDQIKIFPEFRKKEMLNFIDKGLHDFSISRPVERAKHWGIPVPDDPTQMMYVWFDALTNYITILDFAEHGEKYKLFWEQCPTRIHIIGKDIIKFHAIYWPAMLLSAKLPLPTTEFVHGFLTVNGQKMSKSLGNVIYPPDIVKTFGVDAVRYYFLRETPPFSDGDFSESRMRELYNNDLANELGNLVSRVTTLAEKHGISVPSHDHKKKSHHTVIDELIQTFQFSQALELIWKDVKGINAKINEEKPWSLDTKIVTPFLVNYVHHLQEIGCLLQPFLPYSAEIIAKSVSGKIQKAPPLFPRLP